MGVGRREREGQQGAERGPRIIQSTKMSGKQRSISLNCSMDTPASLTTATPNTPEILNAIINISSHHLEKIAANEIELKKEKTNENDRVEVGTAGQGLSSQQMQEDNNINRYHSQ